MPPRKSTASMTPAEEGDSLQMSPQQTTDKPITATEQQIKARAEAGVSVDDYLLPRSLTIRLAKAVLPPNTTIQKDAVLAIQKAATVFISYLSSHANDATLKRTVAPTDVFSALTELEFDSFRARLEQELEAFTEIKAGKRKVKKSDVNGDAPAGAAKGDDEDVEMTENPAKKVKRDDNVEVVIGGDGRDGDGDGDGDETQEEELEEEEGEEEGEEEDEEEEEEKRVEDDIDRVEDLDGGSRPMDPDADETDDEDGPGSQLHNDLGLG
ncbi:Nuclear GTP-binding protein NUG1 [Penicillium atrosanguineum]|uniref:DNA polymerase epsilon subunit D n=1 Tax=Penicillium atrosanguineum TaxID=1132637 RepID=A0A9W9U545_9EURO|nr:Nuclear GTP-binding protein NUG1 [Penicillium atrosanguineum]KAJ5310296.1 Nuclear GTP-binding protein NUG1 [Penicillium atrosanguineum]KAJ5315814.1 hypothetical protein N7476_006121 [Penicillium atrosanguineum]